MKYRFAVLFLTLFIIQQWKGFAALPPYHFVHYSTEDGLPQHTVMGMVQDEKGLMWLVTWDGLCKFDGYSFTTYKIYQEDPYYMKNNRIDHIYRDKYGFLWLQSYDGELHRFDPKTETFQGFQSTEGYENFRFFSSKVKLMPSGKTWQLSLQTGCICASDSTFTTEVYNKENGTLKGNEVFDVFEDQAQNSWILTDNGITLVLADKTKKPRTFFAEENKKENTGGQSFFCATEWDDQIWFGSDKGQIWRYSKLSESFMLLETTMNSPILLIKSISAHEVLIVSEQDGLQIYNRQRGTTTAFNSTTVAGMQKSTILSSYYIDNNQNLWMETDLPGVSRFNFMTHSFKHFQMEGINYDVYPPNFFMFEDVNNRL